MHIFKHFVKFLYYSNILKDYKESIFIPEMFSVFCLDFCLRVIAEHNFSKKRVSCFGSFFIPLRILSCCWGNRETVSPEFQCPKTRESMVSPPGGLSFNALRLSPAVVSRNFVSSADLLALIQQRSIRSSVIPAHICCTQSLLLT